MVELNGVWFNAYAVVTFRREGKAIIVISENQLTTTVLFDTFDASFKAEASFAYLLNQKLVLR